MERKTIYKVNSPVKFTNFLKRFSGIEQSLLIEIENGEIKAKTHTPDRSVVKFSKMDVEDVFEFLDGVDEPLLFGVFNIDKFANSFKHFGNNQFDMIIKHDKLDDKNVGTEIILKNPKLIIKFDCASYKMFTHISDDLFYNTIASDNGNLKFEFDIDKENFSIISSLLNVDSDYKFVKFKSNKNNVFVKGKSFNMNIYETKNDLGSSEITFYKSHFSYIDKENTNVKVADEKIIFSSIENNTIIVIGKAESE